MSGTTMRRAEIAIVGGGLGGLYAAWQLQQHGITDWQVIEARDTLGGRILSVPALAQGLGHDPRAVRTTDRFDLGPSWFWPGHQQQLDQLVRQLGLERFEQHETGDMMVERSPHLSPVRMRGYVNSPPSMRLLGGMGSLIDALHQRLDRTRIATGQTVRRIRRTGDEVDLVSEDACGQSTTWRVGQVLLAMPPRLVVERIAFTPALPATLAQSWQATATWMAPHAKYFAVYERPFWREQGLSGEARSACGPLAEIHDASMQDGAAALFGFFSLPTNLRQSVTEELLRSHCRAQLARLFGLSAAHPTAELRPCLQSLCHDPAAGLLDHGFHPCPGPVSLWPTSSSDSV